MSDSQQLKLQRWLASGQSITPLAALRKFGSMRLGARIYDLRKLHWPIVTTYIQRGRSRFASYRIDRSKS